MLLSEIAVAAGGDHFGCKKRRASPTTAVIRTAAPIIAHRGPAAFADPEITAALSFLLTACLNFSGNSELPNSSVYRLTTETRTPCLTSHSPRSCKCGCHCRYC